MSKAIRLPKPIARSIELCEEETKHIKAMTAEELQASLTNQSFSEAELNSIIDTVRTFTEIAFSVWSKQCSEAAAKSTTISLHHNQPKAA